MMLEKEVQYFVRSTYLRAKNLTDENIKGYFMISHYHDKAGAERHYNAIRNDLNRFLYDA